MERGLCIAAFPHALCRATQRVLAWGVEACRLIWNMARGGVTAHRCARRALSFDHDVLGVATTGHSAPEGLGTVA